MKRARETQQDVRVEQRSVSHIDVPPIAQEPIGFPVGVCIRVGALRARGFQDLPTWLAHDVHVLVTRNGRVSIRGGGVFAYGASEWANPYTVARHGLQPCLVMYEAHLRRKLRDAGCRARFLQLAQATELGCFCAGGAPCHRDVILRVLRELSRAP